MVIGSGGGEAVVGGCGGVVVVGGGVSQVGYGRGVFCRSREGLGRIERS